MKRRQFLTSALAISGVSLAGARGLASEGSGLSHKALPSPNANRIVTSLEELREMLDAFAKSFASAKRAYGISGDEPVIGLDMRTTKPLDLSGYRFSQRITIRGVGTLSRNDFFPTSTTRFGDWSLQNAQNVRLMAIQFDAQSIYAPGNLINAVDCEVSRCVFNFRAATSRSDLARPNKVRDGIYYFNSKRCTLSDNAVVGANYQLVNGPPKRTAQSQTHGLTIAWNVFDQVRGDHIRLQGGSNRDWYIHKNLMGGRYRNPGGDHSDCLQVGAGHHTEFHRSLFEYNCCFVRLSYGADEYAPVQMWWFGRGSGSADRHVFRQNGHFSPGRLINNRVPRPKVTLANSAAQYNTDMAPSDIPGSYSKGRYNADFACFVFSGQSDYNLVTRRSRRNDRGAGPNGLNIECPNSDNSNRATSRAWAPQTAHLTCELQRRVTIGCLRPPSPASRAHWANPRPVGAYDLMRHMFDVGSQNHWKNRGWPVDAMSHIAYDPYNELAGASGDYTRYDSATGEHVG